MFEQFGDHSLFVRNVFYCSVVCSESRIFLYKPFRSLYIYCIAIYCWFVLLEFKYQTIYQIVRKLVQHLELINDNSPNNCLNCVFNHFVCHSILSKERPQLLVALLAHGDFQNYTNPAEYIYWNFPQFDCNNSMFTKSSVEFDYFILFYFSLSTHENLVICADISLWNLLFLLMSFGRSIILR